MKAHGGEFVIAKRDGTVLEKTSYLSSPKEDAEALCIYMGLVLLYTQYMQGRSVFGFDGNILGPMDFETILRVEAKYRPRQRCDDALPVSP